MYYGCCCGEILGVKISTHVTPTSSVILASLDLTQEQTVKLDFSGSVKDKTARTLLLSSESFLDHNAAEEIVKTTEGTLEKFQSGSVITLPPCSMMALIWEEK